MLFVTRLTSDTFTKYVNGQMVEACILGGLCFVGMCVFRFDYAPLISVAVGVFGPGGGQPGAQVPLEQGIGHRRQGDADHHAHQVQWHTKAACPPPTMW